MWWNLIFLASCSHFASDSALDCGARCSPLQWRWCSEVKHYLYKLLVWMRVDVKTILCKQLKVMIVNYKRKNCLFWTQSGSLASSHPFMEFIMLTDGCVLYPGTGVDVVITAATDATLHTWLCASADGGERGIFKILVWYSTLICVLSQSQHTNTYKKCTLCCTVIHRLNHWLTLFFSFFHPALCVDFRLFLNEVYHMLFSAWLVFKS